MKIDNLKPINDRIDQLEFYFRAKWDSIENVRLMVQKFVSYATDGGTANLRKKGVSDGHIVVADFSYDPVHILKYTRSIYNPEIVAKKAGLSTENLPFDEFTPQEHKIYLKVPPYHKALKTWGEIDYIVGEYQTGKSESTIYYIDARLLLEFMRLLKTPTEELTQFLKRNYTGELSEDPFVLEGQLQIQQDLGISLDTIERVIGVPHIDRIDWKRNRFEELRKKNYPSREFVLLMNKWATTVKDGGDGRTKDDLHKARWKHYPLRATADQSIAIAVQREDGEGEISHYSSVTAAAKDLFPSVSLGAGKARIGAYLRGELKSIRIERDGTVIKLKAWKE